VREQLALYVDTAVTRRGRGVRWLSVHLGLAVLLAVASLVAVGSRGGGSAAKPPSVVIPHSGSSCSSPPNGFLYSDTVDGTTMNVCVSQEGNINQIEFPTATSPQIAWDGYCMKDIDSSAVYSDYSPGSGMPSTGWNAATMTVAAANQVTVTRTSNDGKYQLTELIKMNFQPRSVVVGMTIKNVDPTNVTHNVYATRIVAPAIDGSAADDSYNEYGTGAVSGGVQGGRTGQAFNGPGPGTQSLLFGPTQQDGTVLTGTVSNYQLNGPSICIAGSDNPGFVTGGNRVLMGFIGDPSTSVKLFSLAHNDSARVGKFVYRML
jgi:hypothetical protein